VLHTAGTITRKKRKSSEMDEERKVTTGRKLAAGS